MTRLTLMRWLLLTMSTLLISVTFYPAMLSAVNSSEGNCLSAPDTLS